MTESQSSLTETQAGFFGPETWQWWEARRLRYNIALAISGWLAYGLTAALFLAIRHEFWKTLNDGIGTTIFLGVGFLFVMGIANIGYLLGAITESIVKPADRDAFRRRLFNLGFWGSVALPFLFPLANLADLIRGPNPL